jgi:hypothetical protein
MLDDNKRVESAAALTAELAVVSVDAPNEPGAENPTTSATTANPRVGQWAS